MKITRKGISDSVQTYYTKYGYQFDWSYVVQHPLRVARCVVKHQRLKKHEFVFVESKTPKFVFDERPLTSGYWKAHGDRIMWFDHDGAEPRISQ